MRCNWKVDVIRDDDDDDDKEEEEEEESIIDRTFKTGLFSTILCHHCHNISRTKDIVHDISAPIPRVNLSSRNKPGKHVETEEDMQLSERFERLKIKELESYEKNSDNMLNPEEIMQHLETHCSLNEGISVMSCLWGFFRSGECVLVLVCECISISSRVHLLLTCPHRCITM